MKKFFICCIFLSFAIRGISVELYLGSIAKSYRAATDADQKRALGKMAIVGFMSLPEDVQKEAGVSGFMRLIFPKAEDLEKARTELRGGAGAVPSAAIAKDIEELQKLTVAADKGNKAKDIYQKILKENAKPIEQQIDSLAGTGTAEKARTNAFK